MSKAGTVKNTIMHGRRYSGCGEITGTYMTYLRSKAKQVKREFSLSPEYLWSLYLKQNKRCALTGVRLKISVEINAQNNLNRKNMTASLDRIDCSRDYVEGNVQWVHKKVNRMRSDLSVKDFVKWSKMVYEYSL